MIQVLNRHRSIKALVAAIIMLLQSASVGHDGILETEFLPRIIDNDEVSDWQVRAELASEEGLADTREYLKYLSMSRLDKLEPLVFLSRVHLGDPVVGGSTTQEVFLMFAEGLNEEGKVANCLVVLNRLPYNSKKPRWKFCWYPTKQIHGEIGELAFDTWKHVSPPVPASRMRDVLVFHEMFPMESDKVWKRNTGGFAVFSRGWKLVTGEEANRDSVLKLMKH